MQKRGQINAYFVYAILALLILGATILFGFSKVDDVEQTASKAQVLSLKSKISNDISLMAEDYGSVSVKSYHVPVGVAKVCFVDTATKRVSAGLAAAYPLLSEGALENKNMFFIYDNGLVESFDVGKVEVLGPHSICYSREQGFVKIKLKGQGNKAQINEDFSKTISNGKTATFDFLDGLKVENQAGQDITFSVSFSDSGLSDEFTITPDGVGSVYLTIPIPKGYNCDQLFLDYDNNEIHPDSNRCDQALKGLATFTITST